MPNPYRDPKNGQFTSKGGGGVGSRYETRTTKDLAKIKNPNVPLNEARVQQLERQLKSGDVSPLVVEASPKGDFLTDGHHRLEAARRVGVKTLPVIRFDATPQGRSAANKYMAEVESQKTQGDSLQQKKVEAANALREYRNQNQ